MNKIINGFVFEVVKGNIANQGDITAIVNAANALLAPGGGVAGAIHRAAGPGLYGECKPLAPIRTGEAVITGGHNLPNKFVVHTLGPIYGQDKPEERYLSSCYRNSLKVADEKGVDSIAFPAISTGVFGYPIKEATEVAIQTVIQMAPDLKHLKKVRFVLYSDGDYEVYTGIINLLG